MKKTNKAKFRDKNSSKGKSTTRSTKAPTKSAHAPASKAAPRAATQRAPEPTLQADKPPKLRGFVRRGTRQFEKAVTQNARQLEKNVEQLGQAVGQTAERFGQAVEKNAAQLGQSVEQGAQQVKAIEKQATDRALDAADRAPSWLRRTFDDAVALPNRLRNAVTNRLNEERALLERRVAELRQAPRQIMRDALDTTRKASDRLLRRLTPEPAE